MLYLAIHYDNRPIETLYFASSCLFVPLLCLTLLKNKLIKMNKFTLLLQLCLISIAVHANEKEDKHTIVGIIVDNETKLPLSNVEVFISGSTIGTISGPDGKFTLKSPYLPCKIVVMHLSYRLVVLPVNTTKQLTIELKHQVHAINEVSISGKNMRKRNLRLFYKYFLWNTSNHDVKILNDSVLQFDRSNTDLHTSCESPLLVLNKHLGYEIKLIIHDFHIYKKRSNGEKVKLNSASGTALFQLKGYHYYKETESSHASREIQVTKNRKAHYQGSLRHFLSSLYHDKLRINGFSVENTTDSLKQAFQVVSSENGIKQYLFLSDEVSITYIHNELGEPINLDKKFISFRYSKSKLISLGNNFWIRSNGTSPELSFELLGAMAQDSPVNSLPENYKP